MKKHKMPSTKTAGSVLRQFCDILDDIRIEYVLDGGTLLGMYRDGDFCQDDQDDIDLTCFDDPVRMHDILDRASASGFKVYKTWQGGEKSTPQLSMKKTNVKIDLMFKGLRNGKVWWTVYRGNEAIHKAVDGQGWLKRHELPTQYGSFWVHGDTNEDTERYFSERYGEDWKTPVHRDNYSCYSTDKAITTYEEI